MVNETARCPNPVFSSESAEKTAVGHSQRDPENKKNRPQNWRESMRVDKYLKNARIIKRRTIAKEACEQGRVLVNNKTAKPGTEIEIGDEIEIIFGVKPMKIKVEKLLEHVVKDDYKEMYSIIND